MSIRPGAVSTTIPFSFAAPFENRSSNSNRRLKTPWKTFQRPAFLCRRRGLQSEFNSHCKESFLTVTMTLSRCQIECRLDCPPSPTSGRSAAPPTLLDRRARHVAEGAIHTAVSNLRPKNYVATWTLKKELTGLGRHHFPGLMPTLWTSQDRISVNSFRSVIIDCRGE